MQSKKLCLFIFACLTPLVSACGAEEKPVEQPTAAAPAASAKSAAANADTAPVQEPESSLRDDGQPLDEAIVGTWSETVVSEGQRLTVYRRFDSRKQYRGWFAERPDDPGLFGRVETISGTIQITTVDLKELATRYRLTDRDTMVWTKPDGQQSTLRRVAKAPRSPSAASDGEGLGEAERGDRDKCFAQGQRLFQAGEVDLATAWFRRAAALGHVVAQLQLGWHHEQGIGERRDYARAVYWYGRAAQQRDARGMVALARMHERGLGVKEDWIAAARLWQTAAEMGDAQGLYCMGDAYRYGIGVPQDRQKAIASFQQAASRGHPSAAKEARWLSDRTNYVGFISARERASVLSTRLPSAGTLLGGDPAGQRFANSLERIAWMNGFAARVEADEQEAARERDRFYAQLQARRDETEKRREDKVRGYQASGYTRSAAEHRADSEGY